jgi:hypothetical protein
MPYKPDETVDVGDFDTLPDNAVLGPPKVAKILDTNVRTLANWRLRRHGPPFFRDGKFVRYLVGDLKRYLQRGRKATA